MPNIRVSALFRPLSLKEKSEHGDSVSIRAIDTESFIFKVENSFVAFVQDEKEEEIKFHFDRVFFQGSQQADIYEFLALPIVKGVVNGVNGAIITYGQTGAGKTYSMEGPGITECNEEQKGLLPRVVDGLFNAIKLSDDMTRYTIKLSMVEIYLERVRDLFDLSKDNLQIKESKVHGIFVSGVTELSQKMKAEDVQLLEQLFILEGIFFDPNSVEEVESAYDDVTSRTISTLQKAVEELSKTVDEVCTVL
ncbi:UNVERIFIED_CONTAM: Kinesin-like protein KIN-1 [Sesamum calycinum]|uniref:Kinesin-like protein KIN-1 n=1 Tax=Sesamum calycinum TaxID=2727403 RepID=A0AAW2SZM9_9LAMI